MGAIIDARAGFRRRRWGWLAGATAVALAAAATGAAPRSRRVTITDLGVLPGHNSSFANDINARGVIVGRSYILLGLVHSMAAERAPGFPRRGAGRIAGFGAPPDSQAVVWEPRAASPHALPMPAGAIGASAFGLNNRGVIVGESVDQEGVAHATLWEGKQTPTYLPGLAPGARSYASDLNGGGLIVGGALDVQGISHAVTWDSSRRLHDLGTLPGLAHSEGVVPNERGEVLAVAYNENSEGETTEIRLFISRNGENRALGILPGSVRSFPAFMNDRGAAVGAAEMPDGSRRAVLWQGNRVLDLGLPPGATTASAGAINNRGQVFLNAASEGAPARTYLWERGRFTELNRLIPGFLGWSALRPWVANDRPTLVGQGLRVDGAAHAYALTLGSSRR